MLVDAEVLVIGGGVTGCATAYYLARAGASVTLVERSDLNTEASGRNAGGLHGQIQYPPFVELGDEWARAFSPALELLRDSVDLWRSLSDELGTDLEVRVGGGIVVAGTEAELRHLERKAAIEQEAGIPTRLLDRGELQRAAPYVSGRMAGGLLCEIEGKANPLRAGPAFARAARALGARLFARTDVTTVEETRDGFQVSTTAGPIRCSRIVDCAGADTGRVASLVGAELAVERHPIQLAVTEPVGPFVKHLLYYAGAPLTLKQAGTGSVLIGGGWPADRDDRTGRLEVSLGALRGNLRVALAVVPALAGVRLLRTWTGVCPGLADHRPMLGELDGVPGFIVAMFPFLGFTCGPIMGRLAADLALGRDPGRDLTPFSPSRLRVSA